MKTRTKLVLIALMLAVGAISWAVGIMMGYSTAYRNSAYSGMAHNAIILKEVESGDMEHAANWCKSFIMFEEKFRRSKPLWTACLHDYFRSGSPRLSDSISTKIDEVAKNYSPKVIDWAAEFKKESGSDADVKIIIEER